MTGKNMTGRAKNREEDFRNRVYWLTFCFSILVIWVHSFNMELFLGSEGAYGFPRQLEYFFGDTLGQIAVPGFFMMSAFLFYRSFSWNKLTAKWRSRVKSILIPYMLWNFLYYAAYALATRLPGISSFMGKEAVPVTAGAVYQAVFHYHYNPVFWYLYQLILLIVLAPVLYLLLKRKLTGMCFLGAVLFALWKNWKFPHLNMDALLYYSFGAFGALHWKSPGRMGTEWSIPEHGVLKPVSGETAGRTCEKLPLALFAASLVLFRGVIYIAGRPGSCLYMHPLHTVLLRFWGVCLAVFFVSILPLGKAADWMKNNFFLYAIHFGWVRLLNKTAAKLFYGSGMAALLMFLFMPLFMVVISTWLGRLLKRFVSRVYEVLAGGR